MIEIDMFFFFYGTELLSSGHYQAYLYIAKKGEDLDIQQKYLPHNVTFYIDKVVNGGQKKIVTFG